MCYAGRHQLPYFVGYREGNKRTLEEEEEDSDEEMSPSLTEKPTKKKTTEMDDGDR